MTEKKPSPLLSGLQVPYQSSLMSEFSMSFVYSWFV